MKPVWAPVGAAVAVIAVAAGVALLTRGGGSAGQPPVLHLARAADAVASAPAAKVGAAGTSFRLTGSLPTGPGTARSHPLPDGVADEAAVRRLATALGVSGDPVRRTDTWSVGALQVTGGAGRPWQLGGCGVESSVSSAGAVSCSSSGTVGSGSVGGGTVGSGSVGGGTAPGTVTGCAEPAPDTTAGSCGETAPVLPACPPNARCPAPLPVAEPPPVDPAVVRRAAAPVLAALGLADAYLRIETYGGQGAAIVDPLVDGLPTAGFTTRVEVDARGTVLSGSGFLGDPTNGPSYPLLTAQAGFAALPEQPRPLAPDCLSCPPPAPAEVTGARLGLQWTELDERAATLLPAWLFTVKGWPMPLPQTAMQPRFLAPVTEPPVTSPPVDPPSTGTRAPLRFDAAYPSDDPDVVIVQYGDSSSCPHKGVTQQAKESADTVVVLLEADAPTAGQICTDDYRQMLVTVRLDAPLAGRAVISGADARPVAGDRSCARPMRQPPAPKGCRP